MNHFLKIRALDFLALRRNGYEAIHTGNALRVLLGGNAAAFTCYQLEAAALAIVGA